MTDLFQHYPDEIEAPASKAFAITPADADLAVYTRAVYVGGTGTLVATLVDDTAAVTFTAIPAGSILPFRVKRIAAASTATLIVGLA